MLRSAQLRFSLSLSLSLFRSPLVYEEPLLLLFFLFLFLRRDPQPLARERPLFIKPRRLRNAACACVNKSFIDYKYVRVERVYAGVVWVTCARTKSWLRGGPEAWCRVFFLHREFDVASCFHLRAILRLLNGRDDAM